MFKQKKQYPPSLQVSVIALVVGILAGVIGAVITENYLIRYSDTLEDVGIPLRLVEEKPRPLPGTYEEAIEQLRNQALPSLVLVHQVKAEGSSLANQVYLPEQALSSGVIVTSDGWMVVSGHLDKTNTVGSLVVVIDDKVYPVEEMIQDPATDLGLIKIDAHGLPVMAFGAANEVQAGDLAFVLPAANSLLASSVVNVISVGSVDHPVEELQTLWQLADEQINYPLGAPVANSAGELIGLLVDSSGLIRPIHHLLPAIESVLKTGQVLRPSLGLSVIEIAQVIGLSEQETRDYNYGALVTQVTRDGAADQVGVLDQDIILEINGQRVDADNISSDLLLDYQPEDLIRLKVDRDGELLDLELVLE